MAGDGPLDYLTDDELLNEWIGRIRDKDAALSRLELTMERERYVLSLAVERGLGWARSGNS